MSERSSAPALGGASSRRSLLAPPELSLPLLYPHGDDALGLLESRDIVEPFFLVSVRKQDTTRLLGIALLFLRSGSRVLKLLRLAEHFPPNHQSGENVLGLG